MTIRTLDIGSLKRAKNAVIGNPHAKATLAQDDQFLELLVECLTASGPVPHAGMSTSAEDELRIEAVNVIASLAHGSDDSLLALLRARAHEALVYSLSTITAILDPSASFSSPTAPHRSYNPALLIALTRAMRILALSVADAVCAPMWSLGKENLQLRKEARPALQHFFRSDILDIYLPLLALPLSASSAPIISSVAQLLGGATRTSAQREVLGSWTPREQRAREIKGKRGWEKSGSAALESAKGGGWVCRVLVDLVGKRDTKVQEAALLALAALANDNAQLAVIFAKSPPDRNDMSTLSRIVSLCKSRSIDVQLAACLCAARIIRANPLFAPLPGMPASHENSQAIAVLHVLDRVLASSAEPPATRAKACFILYTLVSDDVQLCYAAFVQGCLSRLITVAKAMTPTPSQKEKAPEWDEGEPEAVSLFREAALTAIAAICLFDNDIRCQAIGEFDILPVLQTSISHRKPGVRCAACHCVRALSRTVAAVKTSVVDSGLGISVVEVALGVKFKDEKGSALNPTKKVIERVSREEDRRVINAALAAVCNLVTDFSPLRSVILEKDVLDRLVAIVRGDDLLLRLNALWAIKNLLFKATSEVKRMVIDAVGWHMLAKLLTDSDTAIQEQALNVLKNIADKEDDIEMVFSALGNDILLGAIAMALQSENDDVICQAMYVLAHLANGLPIHQEYILGHARIMDCLRTCLTNSKVEIRRPAISCVLQLAKTPFKAKTRRALQDAGIDAVLRQMCEIAPHSPGVNISPGGRSAAGILRHAGVEVDSDIRDKARDTMYWLERPGDHDEGME